MRILQQIRKVMIAEQKRKYEAVKADYLKLYQFREKYSEGVNIPAFMLAEQKMKSIMANNELENEYRKIANRRKIAA